MKSTLFASALIALTMATSGSAYAQRNDHGYDRDQRNGYAHGQDQRRHDNDRRDGMRGNDRDHRDYRDNRDHRGNGHDLRGQDRYYDARHHVRDDRRGAGPRHNLRRGQRLDREYRDSRYVVSDWRARHLSAPPRGHHWVRAGNDYVLAAIATGLIAQVLLGN
ncbi:RcnB family protein [Massilia oculi]|uniref:RcnB family protein n=1 Tax=Massilia hydrophila TaxID=3044279 RepID=A0ABS7Y8W9_9BURK|nr:RcnB family protein [Massilia oculi]MCA1854769.1 RcnB family protein [Massilia oculi]